MPCRAWSRRSTEAVSERGRPFLGICVGMQLMADWGREHGDHPGLGWIHGDVVALTPGRSGAQDSAYGLEHARLVPAPHPLLAGIAPGHARLFRP